jgi:RND family efflux transporter MFP subunit
MRITMPTTTIARKSALPLAGAALAGALLLQTGVLRRAVPAAPAAPAAATAPRAGVRAEGRLVSAPGAQATVGAELGGRVKRVLVLERQAVKKGQLLVELDAAEPVAALREARARRHEAEASLAHAEAELGRSERLLSQDVVTPQHRDRSRFERDAARARREAAVASAARLEVLIDKARVVSPIDGVVVMRDVEPGEAVAAGAPLVTVADLGRSRIEAEVDEFDVARVKVGDPVTIGAEGFGETWPGVVTEIPDAVVARRLRPQDPGRPTDTRVLLVKVAPRGPTPLKLGQRVELRLGGAR